MYIKEMTYTDFDGNERTEEFRFNLTEAEVGELNLTTEGGLEAYVKLIQQEQDPVRIIELFKKIIDLSYGVKSLDGKYFRKTEEELLNFKSTQAYSDFYMSLIADPEKAAEFINGIVPKKNEGPQDHKKSEKVTPINK